MSVWLFGLFVCLFVRLAPRAAPARRETPPTRVRDRHEERQPPLDAEFSSGGEGRESTDSSSGTSDSSDSEPGPDAEDHGWEDRHAALQELRRNEAREEARRAPAAAGPPLAPHLVFPPLAPHPTIPRLALQPAAAAAAATAAPPSSGSARSSTLADYAEELDRATKATVAGLLDPKLTQLLFPPEVEPREFIALHGKLFSDAAWATVGLYPAQVRMSDLGSTVTGDAKAIAMTALRFQQHTAARLAVIECGIAQLVHRMDTAPLSPHETLLSLANVSRYTAAAFHETQRRMQELIAQVRVSRVEVPEAPFLPASTPQVLAYDDHCRKLVDQLQKRATAGSRAAPRPGGGGGPTLSAHKRGRPDAGRVFGRGGRGTAPTQGN